MRNRLLGFATVSILCLLFATLGSAVSALRASSAAVDAAESAALTARTTLDYGALVGPGFVDSFTVSCDTSATLIQASCGQVSYSAQVDDAAGGDIAFGDSGLTTATGHAIGPGEFSSGNVRYEYCRAAGAAKTIRVRALCASAPSGAALVDGEHHCRKGYTPRPGETCTVWH